MDCPLPATIYERKPEQRGCYLGGGTTKTRVIELRARPTTPRSAQGGLWGMAEELLREQERREQEYSAGTRVVAGRNWICATGVRGRLCKCATGEEGRDREKGSETGRRRSVYRRPWVPS